MNLGRWTFAGFAPIATTMFVSGGSAAAPTAAQAIQHVIIIMQENRSFDHYFGTYPNVAGIPMKNGVPTVCVPDPNAGTCVRPYHDARDVNTGGPHSNAASVADIDGGKMDGFLTYMERHGSNCGDPSNPACTIDVMGYHDAREIPNYWTYAQNFMLQDHMHAPAGAYSTVTHLYLVSEWSALCTQHNAPSSCTNFIGQFPFGARDPINVPYAWTDLTYLLHQHGVSWGYYIVEGTEPDCTNPETLSCVPGHLSKKTWSFWNPLVAFDTVANDGELNNVQSVANFYAAAYAGTLPAVSWVVPSSEMSEHPPYKVSDGQAYVTSLINAVMSGPNWANCVIFLAWDDWGGFYDHEVPRCRRQRLWHPGSGDGNLALRKSRPCRSPDPQL